MKLELNTARQFFADFFYGEHHLPSKIKPWGEGWMVIMPGEIATTDYNEMTRLVIMAHDRAIRVSVKPHNVRYIKLILHQRDPMVEGLNTGHPSILKAIESHSRFMEKKGEVYQIRPKNEQFVLEKPKNVAVILADLKGTEIKTFSSQTECANSLGISRQAVNSAVIYNSIVKEMYRIKLA